MIENIKVGATVKHIKTKNKYRVVQIGRVKVSGKWVTGISYVPLIGDDFYTRTIDDFRKAFDEAA